MHVFLFNLHFKNNLKNKVTRVSRLTIVCIAGGGYVL